MKETLVEQCLAMLKREDIKNECKRLLQPILDVIFLELQPYIYSILALVFILYVMILTIILLVLYILRLNLKK